MSLPFTADQVITLAPDTSSAAAGRKLALTKHWKNLGQNDEAIWGECQGSALYQTRAELATLTVNCSCPSRKLPCKHGIGLLLLAVNSPDAVPSAATAPEWVVSWLAKRAVSAKRKETRESAPPSTTPSASQAKTAEKRLALVKAGVSQLDLWLDDLVRNGIGLLENQSSSFWEKQAAEMVNAQAPGLATRLRTLSGITNATPDWPEKLLGQLGQLALITHSFQRLDQLPASLQEDVRTLVGWSLKEDEVLARGERVSDDWLTLGQVVTEVDHGRSQRIWLLGRTTRRSALIIQFGGTGTTFATSYPLGVQQQAELIFWPGALPQRAFIGTRHSEIMPVSAPLPAHESFEEFFSEVSTTLAQQPWRERFLCVLQNATPVLDTTHNRWQLLDQRGQSLPLAQGEHWTFLALSGGLPVHFVGEWDGEALLPLGVQTDQAYHAL